MGPNMIPNKQPIKRGKKKTNIFVELWPLYVFLVGLASATIFYFIAPIAGRTLPEDVNPTVKSIYDYISPSINDLLRYLRASVSFIILLVATIGGLIGLVVHVRTRLGGVEESFTDDVPSAIELRIFQSVGIAVAARYDKVREQIVRILTYYDSAVVNRTSDQLLTYAVEGLNNAANMMQNLPQKKLTLAYQSDFYLSSWKNRLEALPNGTLCVATSIVDQYWWDNNETWLDFNCKTMDQKDFTWVRIFVLRDTMHKQSLQKEMQKHADRGIIVFALMQDSVVEYQNRDFQDMMLVNCAIDKLKDKTTGIMSITGGTLLGKNTISGGEKQNIYGLELTENEEDLSTARKKLGVWLNKSTPIESQWYNTSFDDRYQEITAFKEKDAKAEVDGIDTFLRKHKRKIGTTKIIDVACAQGRIALLLGQRGYHVKGIDICQPLFERANKEVIRLGLSNLVSFEKKDMLKAGADLGSFNIAISIFNSFGYYDTDDENLTVLKNVYSLLDENGIFILDVDDKEFFLKYRRGQREPMPNSRFAWGRGKIKVECFHSYEKPTLRRRSRFYITENGKHEERPLVSVRLFEESELSNMLRDAGFRTVEVYSNFEFNNFNLGSTEHMICVAFKTSH